MKKWTLRFFALTDLISIILLAEQAFAQFRSFTTDETFTAIQFFSRSLFLLGWCSLFITAILLAIPKKSGILVYYLQLPLRFIFFIFSFGFVSLLTYLTEWLPLVNMLTPAIIFGEFLRIFFTYRIHKDLYSQN